MKYRSRAITEAMKYDGTNGKAIIEWSGNEVELSAKNGEPCIQMKILEKVTTASIGDYIVRNISGIFFPCKQEAFEEVFEEAE